MYKWDRYSQFNVLNVETRTKTCLVFNMMSQSVFLQQIPQTYMGN